MTIFAMVARNFAQGHNTPIRRQNLLHTKSKKAAVAILTRGLTTVKRSHRSRHSYRIRLLDKIQSWKSFCLRHIWKFLAKVTLYK